MVYSFDTGWANYQKFYGCSGKQIDCAIAGNCTSIIHLLAIHYVLLTAVVLRVGKCMAFKRMMFLVYLISPKIATCFMNSVKYNLITAREKRVNCWMF